jgi:hypothetical protein
MADSSIPIEIAGTIQAASINKHPSPKHDINPSTAASKKEPVKLDTTDEISDVDEDEIPVSVLRPVPRRQTLPPLPDLRFEQSYLRSIEKAQSWTTISWITFRDHVSDTDCVVLDMCIPKLTYCRSYFLLYKELSGSWLYAVGGFGDDQLKRLETVLARK